ncbi:MAG TPA: RDD family protein [Steroidobacteraceae bacterium]|nr:RDD family protein [Steroidobacteraceae bacterium]
MSRPAPGLSVDSVTGIDVSLPVAGPGARAFAFLIDWHIRVILALAWFVLGALLYNGRLSLAPPIASDAGWFLGIVAPALAIYLLYHPLVELATHGSTPGKRIAGVRIAARDGSVPGAGALLVRNVFRLVDSLPVFYPVGLVSVVLTRHHLRIGDMAAGTLLVFERADARLPGPFLEAGQPRVLDAQGAELVAELLERWPTLSPESRAGLAAQLLTRYGGAALGAGPADDLAWRERLARLARPA